MAPDNIFVTPFACERYAAVIDDVPAEVAVERILAHRLCILRAAAFGAKKVKVPGLMEIILDKRTVVTVHAAPVRASYHQSDNKRCERRKERNNGKWSDYDGD